MTDMQHKITPDDIPEKVQKEFARLENQYRLDVEKILRQLDSLQQTFSSLTGGLNTVANDVQRLSQIVDGVAAKVLPRH